MPDDTSLPNGAGHTASQTVKSAAGPVVLADAVSLTLEVYIGEARMSLSRFNALRSGGVIELDAGLNAAVEVRLNGVRVAEGELVAVGDQFGVRLTHLSQ
ncbi:FliM/FliN family flagellar motor C-terminal domain-containing protein [Hyphomonas sp.]|uniref:FliM/FliN family flagellar motor C-terminal domain-containing protein n=1 Tax=Hyphomonas sp. TaxID=87 RepID=UPI000AF43439|nr:FliM/FliN family flagellar motor C-terminal domain-containing protein [Hyphomonas sp.]